MTSAPISSASAPARRNRWAIGFADLLLLLLGFFVLLQASGSGRDAMVAQLSSQFGGRPAPAGTELVAATLFEPGEALLTPAGRARLTALAKAHAKGTSRLAIRSKGTDAARQRFDEWDLAAARLGAVARALNVGGIAPERLEIGGLDQGDGAAGKGQHISIAALPAGRN